MASDLRARLAAALRLDAGGTSDFDLGGPPPPRSKPPRAAGVLMGIEPTDRPGFGGGRVLLTVRALGLANHPGQIAFPGGKVEPADAGVTDAALREAREEVGLPAGGVDVVGHLPPHDTVTGFAMTPVVGLIRPGFEPRAELGEVDDIFWAPLSLIGDPACYTTQSRRWHGGRRAYYAVPWGPYYIWGATARVLYGFAGRWRAVGADAAR